jgi:hypothetical protein
MRSPEFLYLVFFFVVNSFWANFYIGTFSSQILDQSIVTVQEEASYGRWFTLIITLGVLGIPLIGAMMDITGYPCTSFITILSGFLWACLLEYPSRMHLIISFIFYSIFRTFLFTFFFAYLPDALGFKYFGVLAGIAFILAGMVSFVQFPLGSYARGACNHYIYSDHHDLHCVSGGNWKLVNTLVMLTIASTWLFTIRDYYRRREHDQLKSDYHLHYSRSQSNNNNNNNKKQSSSSSITGNYELVPREEETWKPAAPSATSTPTHIPLKSALKSSSFKKIEENASSTDTNDNNNNNNNNPPPSYGSIV